MAQLPKYSNHRNEVWICENVNFSVGELMVVYTGIATDCAAEQNLHTIAGGSGNTETVWNS